VAGLACGPRPTQRVVAQRLLDAGLLAASGPVERVSVHGDDRRSLRLAAPGRARFRVRVPRAGVLAFGAVARPPEVKVTLRLREGSGGAILHEESWRETRPWSDRRVDLARLAGREAELVLEVEGSGAWVAISEPEILGLAPPRPSAIVYVVDCLRADRVGAYGYERPTTPEMDRVAAAGYVFEDAHACATWTKPAVGCLFTGLEAPRHRARTVDDVLAPDRRTLADTLAAAGFETAAWVANPVLDGRGFGYARGFDRYVELAQKWKGRSVNDVNGDAAAITEGAVPWLEANRDRAFFLYLHSIDLHYPYDARAGFESLVRGDREGLALDSDRYDSELAYNDREIGKLMQALVRLGLDRSTYVLLTADHGEEFGEHGLTRHGHSVYEELLHIPLLVRPPGGLPAARRIAEPVGEIDLAPTLLALLGVPAPAGLDGRDVGPALRGRALEKRTAFAEQISSAETLYAIREGPLKLIQQLVPEPREMLFDLASDPHERHDLRAARPEAAAGLGARLLPFVQEGQEGRHLVLADPRGSKPLRAELTIDGAILDLVRLVIRTGDSVDIAGDRKGARLTLPAKGVAREFVIRTRPADAPLRVRLFEGQRELPATSLVEGRPTGESSGARAWLYTIENKTVIEPLSDELRERMRALGYVQ